ncbi:MAG TPA: hypothetical protein VFI33_08700 [Puia sp.]|nr:hypothetical protein [Puia sp.]
MLTLSEEQLKENCKRLIENKLGWGSSEHWTNQDFDLLSEKIFAATGVALSQTTLKRIWGKVKYDSAPTVTTLNTLANFIGFENWRDFRQKQAIPAEAAITNEPEKELKTVGVTEKSRRSFLLPTLTIGLTLMSILSWNFFASRSVAKKEKAPAGAYQFSSKKMVLRGVPNSVVFEYDATASTTDSVFIQQSWDNHLRARVLRDQHLHTSIYYYPGFFRAKLLAGDKIVKEHNIFIQTDGWLPLIEQDPVPVYFKKEEAIVSGRLSLSPAKMKLQNVPMEPTVPYVYYANVREFADLTSDNFIFETSVRNDFREGSGVCQKTEIRILTEGSMVSIPLSAKGCISENNLFCLGQFVKGKDNDLSGFGVDFDRFVKLRLEVLNGKARFFVDDKMVYQLDNIMSGTKIKGIVFRFQGTGSVDWVKLSKGNGQLVYEDAF